MMSNPYKGRTGLDRMLRATGYSIDGLKTAYLGESAFRHELWLALALLPFAFWLGRNWVEVALLAGSRLLVLIVELLNSGIEAAIDRVSFNCTTCPSQPKTWRARRCSCRLCCTCLSGERHCGTGWPHEGPDLEQI